METKGLSSATKAKMKELLDKARRKDADSEKYYLTYEDTWDTSEPKKFYVVDRRPEEESFDPLYDLEHRTFNSFYSISKSLYGRHRLFDIDKHLMTAFTGKAQFFELYGNLSVNKNLFILNVDRHGKYHLVKPVFNNNELKAIIDNSPSSTELCSDEFAKRYLSLIQSDRNFYGYLVARRGESLACESEYFDGKIDVLRRYFSNDSTIKDAMVRREIPAFYTEEYLKESIYDDLTHNYPVLRKQLMDTQAYLSRKH